METTIRKSVNYGWKAESNVTLDDIGLENKVLFFSTYRSSNGQLVTTARVEHDNGDYTSHIMFFDYSNTIISSTVSRVTSKAVETQHAQIDLDSVKEQVIEFYKLKERKHDREPYSPVI